MISLDTHVVLWLFTDHSRRLPKTVLKRIEHEDLAISPIVALELSYLSEIGRTTFTAAEIISELAQRIGLRVVDASFAQLCEAAAALSWTRDVFDRLLAAHSIVTGLTLVTKDESMLQNLPSAWWAE